MEEKDKQTAMVTVVIPTYNQKPEFLSACIESVINQVYTNIEIIIADNHSDNGTSQLMAAYEQKDSRIKLVKPPQHLSLVKNFAFAAKQVKTKYFSFLSSDDWVYPYWLQKMLPAVINNDVAWAYGEVETMDIDLQKLNYFYRRKLLPTGLYTAKQSFNRFITLDECGWMPGDIINTAIYFEAGGIDQEGVAYCADLSLGFKLHEKGSVYYLNELVARNRQWYFKDGKVDSRRSVKEVSDFVNIYAIAEKSELLLSLLPQGQQTVNRWKKHYAIKFARILFVEYALAATSKEERNSAADHILQLNNSLSTRLYLLISKNQRLCRWLYSIYTRIKK